MRGAGAGRARLRARADRHQPVRPLPPDGRDHRPVVSGKPTIDELEALEPGSDLDDLIEWTNAQEGRDVCWVGHNPDVEDLAGGAGRRQHGPSPVCQRRRRGRAVR